jgi:hypothetical protein
MKQAKQKRIKRSYTSGSQVLHLWANQTQDSAYSRNVSFDGNKCYSYGSHYELGRIVEFNGVKLALVNDTGWSATTAKHISWAYGAVEHMPRLKTKDLYVRSRGYYGTNEKPEKAVKDIVRDALVRLQGELVERLFSHFNSRSFYAGYFFRDESYLNESVAEFNKTAKLLGFNKLVLDLNEAYIESFNAHVQLMVERKEQLNSPDEIVKRENARSKKLAGVIEKWRQGGQATRDLRNLNPQLLRVKNNEVETTRGASVPLDHALRLLKKIESGKIKAGERVGHFTFDKLIKGTDSTAIVKIGCHTISLNEAKSVLSGIQPKLTLVAQGE